MNSKAERERAGRKARAQFMRRGVAVAAWAAEQGVSASLVYQILDGQKACRRGQSHRIAVLLGMKEGELAAPGASASEAMAAPARRAASTPRR